MAARSLTAQGFPEWVRLVVDPTCAEASPAYGAERPLMRDAVSAFQHLSWLAREEVERFVVLYLNGRNRLLSASCIGQGTLTACLVHPRELFRVGIALNAAAMMVANNPPSGDPAPSAEDVALTERLRKAGELLGIRVLDHVVIAAGRFHSMAESGRWA